MTNEQPEESINIEQWLKDTKIGGKAADIIKKRHVSIEELMEFDIDDLKSFTNELELDALSNNRFIKSITKLKLKTEKSKNNIRKRCVFVSQPESDAIMKLYEQYDKVSKLLLSIQRSIEILDQCDMEVNTQIENSINSVIIEMKNQKNKLLQDIDNMMHNKSNILQQQLDTAQQYLTILDNTKSKYNSCSKQTMTAEHRKQLILKLTTDILDKDNITTTMVTSPMMKFNTDCIKQLNGLYSAFIVNDFDVPKILNLSLRKVYYDAIAMEYSLNDEECITESKPILEVSVEYAILHKMYSKSKVNESLSDESNGSDSSDNENKNELTFNLENVDINSLKWKRKDENIKYHKQYTDYKIGKMYKFKICDVKSKRAYLIRIRARNSSGFGSYSNVIHVITKKHGKPFEVKRGTFSGSAGYSCGGNIDAVSLTSNKNIMLFGVGVFDCKGTVSVQLKVFKGDNNDQEKYISISSRKTFSRPSASTNAIQLNLKKPVKIRKNVKYTIQIDQNNSGGNSYYVEGVSQVTVGKVKICFGKALHSVNGSDAFQSGPFPFLYCSLWT
eukprot:553072_1